jgi:hypothetical protein
MKKIFLIAIVCIISTNLFSQTYKLETVFSDIISNTSLSHWKALEDTNNVQVDTFSLWGYHLYYDDWVHGAYEVEYFKGDAKEMYIFLTNVVDFTEKYKDEDKVLTYISGIQVKTIKQLGFKYTLVYDKERKVACAYNHKQWTDMLDRFVSYCEDKKVKFT